MPRPKTKAELIRQSKEVFQLLNTYIDLLTEEEQNREFPPETLNRNIRDVLGHVHHWHLLFLNWYKTGMGGATPEMPDKGYTWKMTPDLNREIQKKYSNTRLEQLRVSLDDSFTTIQKIIHKHSEEELFEKGKYKWTGTTSLGSYLTSATSSHYDWAYKLIKRCIGNLTMKQLH